MWIIAAGIVGFLIYCIFDFSPCLDATQISKAAIETVAEKTSDGVLFLYFGL